MFTLRSMAATLLLLASLIAAPFSACAAESYDNCAGFIDALPATIATRGVWCLRHDLSTSIASGAAITIATDDVTIDCNDFKLGGLAAGFGTQASGIHATGRVNATVRHCNIRGFNKGVEIDGGDSHVVEDNRFDSNTYIGVYVAGDNSVLRRNQVTDTGGSTLATGIAYGLYTFGAVDVLDNTVSGVLPGADGRGNGDAIGIYTDSNPSGSLNSNRVRGLVRLGTGLAKGIHNVANGRINLDGNRIVYEGSSGSVGLDCDSDLGHATRNIVIGFNTGIYVCGDDGNGIH